MKYLILISLLVSTSVLAHKNKKPVAKLKLSNSKCSSPCTVTLDGSKSKAAKGKTISKYIFELGNGETIESVTPSIEFTYINFKEETDKKKRKNREEKYKKWDKYIKHCHKRFKRFDKFKVKLSVIQSDNKKSKPSKKVLVVKATDILPTIDGDDLIPPIPNKEENDSTLLGIDIDNDGVRDDIELAINAKFAEKPSTRQAFKQIARINQKVLEDSSDKIKSIANSEKWGEAFSCASWIAVGNTARNELTKSRLEVEALSLNTVERIKADIKFNDHLHGAGISPRVKALPRSRRNELCEFSAEKNK